MKTEAPTSARREPERPRADFREVLERRPQNGGADRTAPVEPLAARGAREVSSTQRIGGAKEAVAKELPAKRDARDARVEVGGAEAASGRRFEAMERAPLSLEERLLAQVARELDGPERPKELAPLAPVDPTGANKPGSAAGAEVKPASRAESVREVVEKIELWLKTSRPTLSLTVGGSLQAQITVERTGPGRVSVAFRGKNGPPSHSDVRAVREQLEKRGLLLTSVQLA